MARIDASRLVAETLLKSAPGQAVELAHADESCGAGKVVAIETVRADLASPSAREFVVRAYLEVQVSYSGAEAGIPSLRRFEYRGQHHRLRALAEEDRDALAAEVRAEAIRIAGEVYKTYVSGP